MSPEYPYQLVTFLGDPPNIGERVCRGDMGWYPQIALKRRFSIPDMDEKHLIDLLKEFARKTTPLQLHTGQLMQPERMPVKVIDVINKEEVGHFHQEILATMGARIVSRYPERDGPNYLPHITAEYDGKFIIDVNRFVNKSFTIDRICLVKDAEDTDSRVVAYFTLGL